MQGLNAFLSMTAHNCRLPKYERFVLLRQTTLLGAKRRFRMGVAGWRFKTKNNGRAAVIAVLEQWSVICWVAVAAGAMIMIAAMLYNEWSAAQ